MDLTLFQSGVWIRSDRVLGHDLRRRRDRGRMLQGATPTGRIILERRRQRVSNRCRSRTCQQRIERVTGVSPNQNVLVWRGGGGSVLLHANLRLGCFGRAPGRRRRRSLHPSHNALYPARTVSPLSARTAIRLASSARHLKLVGEIESATASSDAPQLDSAPRRQCRAFCPGDPDCVSLALTSPR